MYNRKLLEEAFTTIELAIYIHKGIDIDKVVRYVAGKIAYKYPKELKEYLVILSNYKQAYAYFAITCKGAKYSHDNLR